MRWKFKLQFKPDWNFLFDCLKNMGTAAIIMGMAAQILDNNPKSAILLMYGIVFTITAWIGKSFKVSK